MLMLMLMMIRIDEDSNNKKKALMTPNEWCLETARQRERERDRGRFLLKNQSANKRTQRSFGYILLTLYLVIIVVRDEKKNHLDFDTFCLEFVKETRMNGEKMMIAKVIEVFDTFSRSKALLMWVPISTFYSKTMIILDFWVIGKKSIFLFENLIRMVIE